jgi:large subunit ribosomal protein L17
MKHRSGHRKLGRTSEHRTATLRNLAASLFKHERITTTLEKAKELRSYAERLITKARRDSVHSRRQVARELPDRTLVKRLFDDIAPRYSERPGGYTRVLRLGPRRGDNAEMAIIELVSGGAAPASRATDEATDAEKQAAPAEAAGD